MVLVGLLRVGEGILDTVDVELCTGRTSDTHDTVEDHFSKLGRHCPSTSEHEVRPLEGGDSCSTGWLDQIVFKTYSDLIDIEAALERLFEVLEISDLEPTLGAI